MTRKQGVIFRLVIVLAILTVLSLAAYVVVKKFFIPSPWEKISAAIEMLDEARALEAADKWEEAQVKLALATKLAEDVVADESPYAMDVLGDINRLYADHYRKDSAQLRQARIYVEQALDRYRRADDMYAKFYGKGNEQRLKPTLKRCKMLHYYSGMRAYALVKTITDDVLKSVQMPVDDPDKDKRVWRSYWAGVKSYNAWSTEQYGLSLLIAAQNDNAKGEVKKEKYQAIKDEYEKALKGYLDIIGVDYDPAKVADEMPDLFKLTVSDMYMQAAQVELRISDTVFQIELARQPQLAAKKHNEKAEEYFAKAMELVPTDRISSFMISAIQMKSQFGRACMENDDVEPSALPEYLYPGLAALTAAVEGEEGEWKNAAYVFIAQANVKVAEKARERAAMAREIGLGKMAAALEAEAVASEESAVGIFETGLERLNNDIVLLKYYLAMLIGAKRQAQARIVLDKVLEDIQDPQNQIAARQELVQLLLTEASEAETDAAKDAKIAEAAKNLQVLMKADPNGVGTHQLSGRLYMIRGEQKQYDKEEQDKAYAQAEKHYKLITSDSKYAVSGHSLLGDLYTLWDKPDKAEAAYVQAAELTSYAGARECNRLIRHYMNKKRIAAALAVIANYKAAVTTARQQPDPNIKLAEAQILSAIGKYEDSRIVFEALKETNKTVIFKYYYAASVLQDPAAGMTDLLGIEDDLAKMWAGEKVREEAIEKRNVEFLCRQAECLMRLCVLPTATQVERERFAGVIREMEALRKDLDYKGRSEPSKYGDATAERIKALSSTIYTIYTRPDMKKDPMAQDKAAEAAEALLNLEDDSPEYQNMYNDAMLFGRSAEDRSKLKTDFLAEKVSRAEADSMKTGADEEKRTAAERLKFWRLRYAAQLESIGHRDEAIAIYKKYPDDFNVVLRLAQMYLGGSGVEIDEAKDFVEKMEKIDPVHASTITMRIRYEALKEKDVVKRVKTIEAEAEKNPILEVYMELAQACYIAANSTGEALTYKEKAITAMERAHRLVPGDINTLLRLAQARLEVAQMRRSIKTDEKSEVFISDTYISPASRNIEDILALNPDSIDALMMQARIAQFKKDPTTLAKLGALETKLLDQAAELRRQGTVRQVEYVERNLYDAYMMMSAECKNASNFVDAEKYADKAKEYGNKIDAELQMVGLQMARHHYKQAIADMERLMADEASVAEANDDIRLRRAYLQTLLESIQALQGELGDMTLGIERSDEIRADIRAFSDKFEDAVEKSIGKYPDSIAFKYSRIVYLERIALRPEEADLLAEAMRRELLGNPALPDRVSALATLAQFYGLKGNDENIRIAESLYLEALKAQPNNANLNRAMVLNLYVPHQDVFPDKAMSFVDERIADNPDNVAFLMLKAETLDSIGRPYQALEAWQAAVNQAPDNPQAHLGSINAYLRYESADPQKARDHLIELLVDVEPLLKSIPVSNALGRIYYDSGRYDEAQGCFDRVAAIDAENAEAMYYSARILFDRISRISADADMGTLDEAVIVARRAAGDYLKLHSEPAGAAEAEYLAGVYVVLAGCEAYSNNPQMTVEYLKKAVETNLDANSLEQLRRIYLIYDWPQLQPDKRNDYSAAALYDWIKAARVRGKDNDYQTQLSLGCAAMLAETVGADAYLLAAARVASIETPGLVEPYVMLDIDALIDGNATLAEERFGAVRDKVAVDLDKALAAIDLYMSHGHRDRALRLLEHFIPLAKEGAETSGAAAVLLARLARIHLLESATPDVAAARKLLDEALQFDAENVEARWMRGWIDILNARNQSDPTKLKDGIAMIEKVDEARRSDRAWAALAQARAMLAETGADAELYAKARNAAVRSLAISPVYGAADEMRELHERIKDK